MRTRAVEARARAGYPPPMAKTFQAPTGTRDFYPEDLLRRRYIIEQWRAASVRHGFEEIDGPTFEHAELYTVKSGEGILSELFSFTREGGDTRYALRPEFTPTLARLYAARAASLPNPVRWFCIPNFFRAERPQRGRLREFGQWNCDVIGGGGFGEDAEVAGVLVAALDQIGLTEGVRVHTNHRQAMADLVTSLGIDPEHADSAFVLLDRRDRLSDDDLEALAYEFGVTEFDFLRFLKRPRKTDEPLGLEEMLEHLPEAALGAWERYRTTLTGVGEAFASAGVSASYVADADVVRGLAYYTGSVFEVLARGERAVAGGGRYDKLIELFGGPPTPACGFGMGDAVLANLMDDHDLFPAGHELRDAIDGVVRSVSLRPEVFVVSGGEDTDALVTPLLARLRQGTQSEAFQEREGAQPWDADRYDPASKGVRPLHARTTSKTTRNLKKLLTEAEKLGAKTAAVIHGPDKVQLKDLRTREDLGDYAIEAGVRNALGEVPYVGAAIAELL